MSYGFVDFRLYAAFLLVELLLVLESLSKIVATRIPVATNIEGQTIGPDFETFVTWLDLYTNRLIAIRDGTLEASFSRRPPPVHSAFADRLAAKRMRDED
jgi:hypothetical protein